MKLLKQLPDELAYFEPWPFAAKPAVYAIKRKMWLESQQAVRKECALPKTSHAYRMAQVELWHLRNAYYRHPNMLSQEAK